MISSEKWFASMGGDICTAHPQQAVKVMNCICRYDAHWSSHAMQQTLLTFPSSATLASPCALMFPLSHSISYGVTSLIMTTSSSSSVSSESIRTAADSFPFSPPRPILATFADVFPAPVQRLFLPHPSFCFGSSPVTIRPDPVDSLGLIPKFESKTARAAGR